MMSTMGPATTLNKTSTNLTNKGSELHVEHIKEPEQHYYLITQHQSISLAPPELK